MNRRNFLLTCAGLLTRTSAAAGRSHPHPRVVFLNPGEPMERGTGPFWRTVARFMTDAARALGMELEVLWAERDDLLMLRQCEEVARRATPPHYVVIVNQERVVQRLMTTLARSSSRIFLIHNDVTPEQRREIGSERQSIRNWIGTATDDSARGGYLLMEYLQRRLGRSEAQVIGIMGDPGAPITKERMQGVEDFLARGNRGRILQVVYGDPSHADGERKASLLLSRYPEANVILATNDLVALGAVRAVKHRGVEVLVGSMGGTRDALASIAQGGLTATAAGHYLIGACVMVMLYDYHHGKDFAVHGGSNQKLDYLYVVQRDNVACYDDLIFRHDGALDFGIYSRALHPRTGRYDFRLERLLDTPKGRLICPCPPS
ncbi:ABC transporter substrate-binding protein [Azoarcus sp. KH32C]|uniref:ABC transporter substrate-binding protein n=1 Tax=Azoarcus sp. KH32C TaxID=748247 RepID=UPI0002385E0E|nr:ABC transporter substrate-binding protein [Azoarcus sp. KH32C]BAL27193.1 hypothetical protein AZKH_p0310 [Azoarcus sp. KH32C]